MENNWEAVNFTFCEATNLQDIIDTNDNVIDDIITLYADYNTVKDNFDYFIWVVENMMANDLNTINVDSYKTVKFINNHLKDKMDIVLNVLDDYENRTRKSIIKEEIDKCSFTIPLSYIMWDVNFEDFMNVNLVTYHNNALNYNGNTKVDIDTLKKIRDLINELNSLGKFTPLQIIILVSNYLQKNTEYISDNVDECGDFTAILDDKVEGLEDEVGLIETVLFKHYGLCTGIANATTVLLNNPVFKINARTIFNEDHALNIVKYKGEYYFIDNTWNITRSKKSFPKAIKTREFNSKYILYGKKMFNYYIDKEYLCSNPNIDKVGKRIKEEEILKAKGQMMDRVSFKYNNDIVHPLTKVYK